MVMENIPRWKREVKVYIVTNLKDSGPGSFARSRRQKEPRIIISRSSPARSEPQSQLTISGSDVTIAGQSAPGDGICLKNYQVYVHADNVILRFLRFRLGDGTSSRLMRWAGTTS